MITTVLDQFDEFCSFADRKPMSEEWLRVVFNRKKYKEEGPSAYDQQDDEVDATGQPRPVAIMGMYVDWALEYLEANGMLRPSDYLLRWMAERLDRALAYGIREVKTDDWDFYFGYHPSLAVTRKALGGDAASLTILIRGMVGRNNEYIHNLIQDRRGFISKFIGIEVDDTTLDQATDPLMVEYVHTM